MRSHFFLTLMVITIAVFGREALASGPAKTICPVVTEISSPIVGSQPAAPGLPPYVFPDAIDLNQYVYDDTTPPDQIKWSYAIVGTPRYMINGVDPLDLAQDDPTSPGLKQINNHVLNEFNPDRKANTITIHNIHLQPFNGAGATPSGTGIIDPQVVTLIASDGTTWSSQSLIFSSDNGGASRLSQSYTPSPATTVPLSNWTWNGYGNITVSATASTNGSSTICIATPMTGGGYATWSSPYGALPLVDNAVYRIQVKMNFTQAQANARTPFWDLSINNFYVDPYGQAHGQNLYGGDFYFFENEGQAQAVQSAAAGGSNVEVWWCPTPIQTTQWQQSIYSSAMAADKNAFLTFRVMDVDDVMACVLPKRAGGTLCLEQLQIQRYDLAALTQRTNLTPVYSKTSFSPSGDASAIFNSDAASKADFTSGTITLTPGHTKPGYAPQDGQQREFGTVVPGDTDFELSHPSSIPDNFPICWEPFTLYMTTMTLSAPDVDSENNPWDMLWLGMDSPTNEVVGESYVTGAANHAAMPRQGTPQTYTFFYWSGNGTQTTITNGNTLRWKLYMGNNEILNFNKNSGSLRLHSVTMNKVRLPG